jgi:DNA-binding transcriptional MocR family regulator
MEGELDVPGMRISDEDTKVGKKETSDIEMAEDTRVDTVKKQPAPGKMMVKVKKTKTFIDSNGYMVTEDYESMEERDYVEPKKQAAKTSEKVEKRAPAPTGPKKQAGISSFFKAK